MNKDIFEENDRNIRVFGLETQKKLFESEVLIMNLTPMMAELCKNLILSGVGIYLFNNTSTINKIDSEKSFFFNINDVGKKKVEVFKEKIKMFKENCIVNLINNCKDNFLHDLIFVYILHKHMYYLFSFVSISD